MGCILALLALIAPRCVIVLLALFSHYMSNAFQTTLWPVLGFLFMPVTTLAYAFSINTYHGVSGLGLVAVVVGVLIDCGFFKVWSDAGRKARRHREN